MCIQELKEGRKEGKKKGMNKLINFLSQYYVNGIEQGKKPRKRSVPEML